MSMQNAVALVVDDHPAVRRALCDRIQTAFDQLQVREADTVDTALQIVAAEQVDLVLMDIHLPGMDGIDGTRAVLDCSPGTAVVMVSIFDDLNHRAAASEAGASAFVCKRAIGAELIPTLQKLMAGASARDRWARNGPNGAARPGSTGSLPLLAQRRAGERRQNGSGRRRGAGNRMEQSCRSECADFNAAIVNAAADAIVVLDEQHQIRRFNPGAERMFGFRETEVLGKAVALLWSAQEGGGNAVNDLDMHRSEKAAFELTIGHGREFVARRKDGTQFPALVSVGEAQSGKQRVKTCVVRDITEARHTATRHAILVAELEAANRELDSFGYSVSHELRAPLRVLDGFSRMLVESHGGRLDEEGLQLLGAIRANSMKMGNLIRDLLHFSKLGRTSLSVAEIDMNKLVQDALIEVQSSAGVHTRTCSVDVLPVAVCDREMLLHVWVNLLSNAFKFSSKRDQPRVRVSAQSDNAETVYCVSDNGTGFDMRYSGKLFGVFQRLHGGNEYPGTGVGLSIVQRIVSRHGGRVWAESRTGEGATFYFTLPHHSIPMQTLEK